MCIPPQLPRLPVLVTLIAPSSRRSTGPFRAGLDRYYMPAFIPVPMVAGLRPYRGAYECW